MTAIRFKDIALLCGDENDYRHLIEAVFSEYEIPYFTDRTILLSDHPIAMQILSLFSILEDDWSYVLFSVIFVPVYFTEKNNTES